MGRIYLALHARPGVHDRGASMITSLNEWPDETILETDVCIIGTGVAGLIMALEFLDTDTRIVMLEGGEFGHSKEGQEFFRGEVASNPFRGLEEGRSRQFGGTSSLWGGQCVRLDPMDFESRPWIPCSGWPISYNALAPFYDRARDRLDISTAAFAPDVWRRFGLPAFDFDPAELRPVHGVFIRKPKLGRRLRRKLTASRNIHVLLGANVTHIGTNTYGTQVSDVRFRGLNQKMGMVRARRIVLCAGGIENARLLLLSRDTHRGGLGNNRDLVGRYLNDHPCGRTALVTTDNPQRLQDHFNMLYSRRALYLPKMALSGTAQRRERTLNCVGRLVYDFGPKSGMKALRDIIVDLHLRRWPEDFSSKLARVVRAAPLVAPSAWRLLRHGLSPAPPPSLIWLETFTEQTPDPESRITLSDTTDALGLPRAKIDWKLDSLTGHTLRTFTNSVDREFRRLGLGTLQPAEWLHDPVPRCPDVLDSYHPSGTTRMAADPSEGVVDANCQVFGVDGLYIAGSSVFPNSGVANPTFSIAALAIRLADHIKSDLKFSYSSVVQSSRSLVEAGAAA
jgi:choline dehydrogenase-like flavoprotein